MVMDVEAGNLKPEAAYFTGTDGHRSGYLFFEMQDASRIPATDGKSESQRGRGRRWCGNPKAYGQRAEALRSTDEQEAAFSFPI